MYTQSTQTNNSNVLNVVILFASIIISGTLYFYSTGFNELWYLLWFAPIPVITCSLIYNKKNTFFIAFIASLIGELSILNYIGTGLPILVLIPSLISDPLIFASLILLNRYVVHKINNWTTIFFFPFVWVGYEFLLSLFSSAGSLNSIAYTQIKFLPLIQIASYTGIWGITFLILLFGSGISCAFYFRKRLSQSIASITIAIAIIGMALGYGFIKLSFANNMQHTRVGLAAIKTPIRIRISGSKAIKLSNEYISMINKIAQDKVTFVVLPEKFIRLKPQTYTKITNIFKKAARQNNIYIIAGIARFGTKNYNSAVIFSPKGKILSIYNKTHMVPKLEDQYTPGNKTIVFDKPVRWGVAICKDMDFSGLGINYAKKQTQLMLVPALDFNIDDWIHARIAVMRGVENGFSVARAANHGLLSVSNQFGQIITAKKTYINKYNYLIANVPLSKSNTFYSRFGNWFGWLSIFFLIIFTLYSVTMRGKFLFHNRQASS